MTPIFVLPGMALLNAVRGGHFGGERLPGHPRYWVAAAVFALAWASVAGWQAFLFAVGYLAWSLPPWGHLIGLGRYAPDRSMSELEKTLLWASMGCVHGALWFRHWFILPMVWAASLSPWALILAPAIACFMVLAYELAWRLTPATAIRTAEVLVGAILGALLLASCRADTNAYYARGGSTGAVHCRGACE